MNILVDNLLDEIQRSIRLSREKSSIEIAFEIRRRLDESKRHLRKEISLS